MTQLIYLFAAVVVIASILAGVAIWAPRSMWVKAWAFCLTAALMPTAYAGFVELLGKPKPVTLEWARDAARQATVLGASLQEGKAIYLWVRLEESLVPRAYVLPWSRRQAEQLQDAMRQAEANGSAVRMRGLAEVSQDSERSLFYAEPQPALPPKGLSLGNARSDDREHHGPRASARRWHR
jgi:hypothetical protein